jgi:hypothetical protein
VKLKGTPLVGESGVPDSFSSTPRIYSFNLHGSAFLWHQVRHMVAILFLIGQGLESPSIIPELLDISKNPCKPLYEMASDAPLVLWDCIFPDPDSKSRDDALEWVYAGDAIINTNDTHSRYGKYTQGGLVERLWSVWRQRKMDEVLTATRFWNWEGQIRLRFKMQDTSLVKSRRQQTGCVTSKPVEFERVYKYVEEYYETNSFSLPYRSLKNKNKFTLN